MMDHRYYVGPIGSLQQLPDVYSDTAAAAARVGGTHVSLTGAQRLDTFGYKRSWTWAWSGLRPTQVPYVEALQYGMVPGPLRLIDPRRANRLPEQVAAGGSLLRSSRGFDSNTGFLTYRPMAAVPADPSTLPARALLRGAIEWARPGSGSGAVYPDGDSSDRTWRTPVLPGEPVELSVWAVGPPGTAMSMNWREYNAAGQVTDRAGAVVGLSYTTWTRLSSRFTPAAAAVAVSPRPSTTPGSVAGRVCLTAWQHAALDADQLGPEFTEACWVPDPSGGWRPGGGAPVVVVDQVPHSYGPPGLHDLGLTLTET